MDGRTAAMDRYQQEYGGKGLFGLPRTGISDFLSGMATPADPRAGFFGALQTGLGGAMAGRARRMETLDEMERRALMQDLEERRVKATEQSAGADVTRANADLWRAQHPGESWNDPTRNYQATLDWLHGKFPDATDQQLVPMIGGIDQMPSEGPNPMKDPQVFERVANAYAGLMHVPLDTARAMVRTLKATQYTEEQTVPMTDPHGRVTGLTKRKVARYAYGIPQLDAALNMETPGWAGSFGGGDGAPAPTAGAAGLNPALMSPEDAQAYQLIQQGMKVLQGKYGGAGR